MQIELKSEIMPVTRVVQVPALSCVSSYAIGETPESMRSTEWKMGANSSVVGKVNDDDL
jgi:hypothetical protein